MKKNKMMRIASVLLIVTILSAVAISGTFAKYITEAQGNDSARVAQWGIQINTSANGLFQTSYTSQNGKTVEAAATAATRQVVAPGTSGQGFTADITGTTEVMTKLYIDLSASEDIVVPAGTYRDYTTNDANATFTSAYSYSPVKFNIGFYGSIGNTDFSTLGYSAANPYHFIPDVNSIFADNGIPVTTTPGVSLTEYNAFIAQQAAAGTSFVLAGQTFNVETINNVNYLTFIVPAGKELNCHFVVDWEWAFEGPYYSLETIAAGDSIDFDTVDKLDTYIGATFGENDLLTYRFVAGAVQVD